MLPSVAMRKGIEATKPIRYYPYRWGQGQLRFTCALGALHLGTFGAPASQPLISMDMFDEIYTSLRVAYPALNDTPPAPWPWPSAEEDESEQIDLLTLIYEAFDGRHATREQIADWLESVGL